MGAISRYLLTMATFGGVGGALHGAVRGYVELLHDTRRVQIPTLGHALTYMAEPAVADGLHGALMAPWAPLLIPLSVTAWRGQLKCPHFRVLQ